MTDYEYDPDFPYVLVNVDYRPHTRWAVKGEADRFLEKEWEGYGRVIDTTPRPKIPDDAEFVYYMSWANSAHYAKRVGHPNNHVWETSNPTSNVSEEDLLIRIGDAEVTVLVRKEDL